MRDREWSADFSVIFGLNVFGLLAKDLSLVGTRVESVLPQLGMDASKEIDGG